MPSILFVCAANMCRSPMASVIFRSKLSSRADHNAWRVESAGVWAMDGRPAASGCQKALEKMHLDASGHRAQTVSREILRGFNLILTMERGQKEALKYEYPELSGRIFMLSEMIGMTRDVRDPVGGSAADFDDTASEIERLLEKGFAQIEHLASRAE